ncbi:MAG TPA: NIPSNAP family protein, partial [Thermoanaerobaculia bacterium]
MIAELRQYTLHPGQRDTLVSLFEREFLTTQADAGMPVLGRFLDLGDADRFVWLRGFPDMERRKQSLTSFYDGPVWRANRDAANATMIDSDDVLLLRHVDGTYDFDGGTYALMVYSFDAVDDALVGAVRDAVQPLVLLRTEEVENNYPRLPVRQGEHVIVAITREPRELP